MSTRLERYALAKRRLAEGKNRDQVRVLFGLSYSGLNALLNDPDGSKQKARRERYRGTCARCGGKTDGSCGYQSCSIHCAACAAIVLHENRRWTREAMIEAIQLWAAEHDGCPPLAEDWIRASDDGRFPNRGSVYRTSTNPGPPFAKWADAIEAAGFPRPWVGVYGDREHWDQPRIIAAIQQWVEEYGELPSVREWHEAQPGRPTSGNVAKHFGSWNNAIEAAGFTPRAPGGSSQRKVAA